jgi:hypothetical protein
MQETRGHKAIRDRREIRVLLGIQVLKVCQVIRDHKAIAASSVRQDQQDLQEKQATMVRQVETGEMEEMA